MPGLIHVLSIGGSPGKTIVGVGVGVEVGVGIGVGIGVGVGVGIGVGVRMGTTGSGSLGVGTGVYGVELTPHPPSNKLANSRIVNTIFIIPPMSLDTAVLQPHLPASNESYQALYVLSVAVTVMVLVIASPLAQASD